MQKINFSYKTMVAIALSLTLSACATMPGSNLIINNQHIVNKKENGFDISKFVDVYLVTPQILEALQSKRVVAQPNVSLDKEMSQYQYTVGPGDILNIIVWEHPELTIPAGSYRSAQDSGSWVHADGTIYYPYIGRVNVSGKTIGKIRTDIITKLSQYIASPQVDVSIAAFRSQKVYVTGEVKISGKQPITNIPLTILDAINNAEGLTDNADWNNVVLTQNGQQKQISLQSLLQDGDLTQNQLLQDGDILYIPRNDGLKVFVLGEVNKPATLKMDRTGMTLTEAIGYVGDINQLTSNAKGVFVIRPNVINKSADDKLATIYQFNLSDATALVLGTDFKLKPYDVVYVTSAPIVRWNRVISQLIPTISGIHDLTETVRYIRNW